MRILWLSSKITSFTWFCTSSRIHVKKTKETVTFISICRQGAKLSLFMQKVHFWSKVNFSQKVWFWHKVAEFNDKRYITVTFAQMLINTVVFFVFLWSFSLKVYFCTQKWLFDPKVTISLKSAIFMIICTFCEIQWF